MSNLADDDESTHSKPACAHMAQRVEIGERTHLEYDLVSRPASSGCAAVMKPRSPPCSALGSRSHSLGSASPVTMKGTTSQNRRRGERHLRVVRVAMLPCIGLGVPARLAATCSSCTTALDLMLLKWNILKGQDGLLFSTRWPGIG